MDVVTAGRKPLGNEVRSGRAVFNYSNEKLGRKKLSERRFLALAGGRSLRLAAMGRKNLPR